MQFTALATGRGKSARAHRHAHHQAHRHVHHHAHHHAGALLDFSAIHEGCIHELSGPRYLPLPPQRDTPTSSLSQKSYIIASRGLIILNSEVLNHASNKITRYYYILLQLF